MPSIQTGNEMNYPMILGSMAISLIGVTTGVVILKRTKIQFQAGGFGNPLQQAADRDHDCVHRFRFCSQCTDVGKLHFQGILRHAESLFPVFTDQYPGHAGLLFPDPETQREVWEAETGHRRHHL